MRDAMEPDWEIVGPGVGWLGRKPHGLQVNMRQATRHAGKAEPDMSDETAEGSGGRLDVANDPTTTNGQERDVSPMPDGRHEEAEVMDAMVGMVRASNLRLSDVSKMLGTNPKNLYNIWHNQQDTRVGKLVEVARVCGWRVLLEDPTGKGYEIMPTMHERRPGRSSKSVAPPPPEVREAFRLHQEENMKVRDACAKMRIPVSRYYRWHKTLMEEQEDAKRVLEQQLGRVDDHEPAAPREAQEVRARRGDSPDEEAPEKVRAQRDKQAVSSGQVTPDRSVAEETDMSLPGWDWAEGADADETGTSGAERPRHDDLASGSEMSPSHTRGPSRGMRL